MRPNHQRSIRGAVEPDAPPYDYRRLFQRHWRSTLLLTAVGLALSLVALVWQKPVYKTQALLEVNSLSANYRNSSVEPVDKSFGSDGADMLTESRLLEDGPVMQRVVERMSSNLSRWPKTPGDSLAVIRSHVRSTGNLDEEAREAIDTAAATFSARPVNGTRLMEISCQATNPAIAAEFLNGVAEEFIKQTTQSRAQAAQQTTEWLSSRLSAQKDKLKEAEAKLHQFLQHSNEFYGTPESTMDDPKLKQLQASLATAQAQRIKAQAAYETALKSNPNAVPVINSDPTVQTLRSKLQDLDEQKTALSNFTPNYPKLKRVEISAAELQKALNDRIQLIIEQLHQEYTASVRQEDLLRQAFVAQGSQVAARAGVAADYVTLSHEVENYRTLYEGLLRQVNQSQIGESLPTTLVQLVQPCEAPRLPYQPKPGALLSIGLMAGLAAGLGVAFYREKKDNSVQHPGMASALLSLPELGVIPSMRSVSSFRLQPVYPPNRGHLAIEGPQEPNFLLPAVQDNEVAQAAWGSSAPILAESFRKALTSLKREAARSSGAKAILVTSAHAGDGKTTMVTNLGIGLAESGARVLLVDADFRRSRLSAALLMETEKGLCELIEGSTPVNAYRDEELRKPTGIPNLFALPCGKAQGNVSTLHYSKRLPEIMQRLKDSFDFILYDAPPVMPLADSRLIAQMVDGVVLIVRAGKTSKAALQSVKAVLADDEVPILGTILNAWEPSRTELRNEYSYYL